MTSHRTGGIMNKQQRVYIDGKIYVARGNHIVRVR
ncbi:hypothetical protein FDI09_gp08 [Mycobacterium phage Twister]|uniref:Uncharacterized protein n=3 Tax=Fromanvirus TaxID=186764 RepID=H9NCL3_9CAUD|nr:hypothetical protein FDI09_gp08 [Mycobacterium phage Twister]AFF28334.1 hypothetical protein TWISTER_87 [Mycobacterium phage Twister]QGJ94759.1 hypothetical protein SEA_WALTERMCMICKEY_86 [Mycobacterium phage WalterMcMickey]QLF84478.1 hypothetical protein SEA_TOPANGA_76 [Mycobacterium phage Topanga]